MARKKQSYIKGTFTHRRTEADYMGVLLDAVPLEDWREVVSATVAAAKAGDATARAWLAQYLVGKPGTTAPAPLTVMVQQLSGRDPLVERLAKPHIDRAKYPSFRENDDFDGAMRELIAGELRALEAQKSNTPETGTTADGNVCERIVGGEGGININRIRHLFYLHDLSMNSRTCPQLCPQICFSPFTEPNFFGPARLSVALASTA